MKTKVVWHVPRIDIAHLAHYLTYESKSHNKTRSCDKRSHRAGYQLKRVDYAIFWLLVRREVDSGMTAICQYVNYMSERDSKIFEQRAVLSIITESMVGLITSILLLSIPAEDAERFCVRSGMCSCSVYSLFYMWQAVPARRCYNKCTNSINILVYLYFQNDFK